MPNKERYRARAPVSAEPELVPWLPAAAAVFGSDCLFRPPRELEPVELQEPPAGVALREELRELPPGKA